MRSVLSLTQQLSVCQPIRKLQTQTTNSKQIAKSQTFTISRTPTPKKPPPPAITSTYQPCRWGVECWPGTRKYETNSKAIHNFPLPISHPNPAHILEKGALSSLFRQDRRYHDQLISKVKTQITLKCANSRILPTRQRQPAETAENPSLTAKTASTAGDWKSGTGSLQILKLQTKCKPNPAFHSFPMCQPHMSNAVIPHKLHCDGLFDDGNLSRNPMQGQTRPRTSLVTT